MTFDLILRQELLDRSVFFLCILGVLLLGHVMKRAQIRSLAQQLREAKPGEKREIRRQLEMQERSSRRLGPIWVKALAIVLIWGYFVFPIMQDLSLQSYRQVEGTQYISEMQYQGRRSISWRILIDENGQRRSLHLPSGWTVSEFPKGRYYGTIWYAEHSRIALRFEKRPQ